MGNKCFVKCHMDGCNSDIGFIESSFGIRYCEECEKLFMTAKSKNMDISLCKTKKDLIKRLEEELEK